VKTTLTELVLAALERELESTSRTMETEGSLWASQKLLFRRMKNPHCNLKRSSALMSAPFVPCYSNGHRFLAAAPLSGINGINIIRSEKQ
jgi:hypothetical protein